MECDSIQARAPDSSKKVELGVAFVEKKLLSN
jgi:hypothetical protein